MVLYQSFVKYLLTFPDPTGHYDAHLARQAADLRVFAEDESLILDPELDYSSIPGLSGEVIEKLCRIRPTTIVCLPSLVFFAMNGHLIR